MLEEGFGGEDTAFMAVSQTWMYASIVRLVLGGTQSEEGLYLSKGVSKEAGESGLNTRFRVVTRYQSGGH